MLVRLVGALRHQPVSEYHVEYNREALTQCTRSRNHHNVKLLVHIFRGISSFGRAAALQAVGDQFDPDILHHNLGAAVGCGVPLQGSCLEGFDSLGFHQISSVSIDGDAGVL